MNFIHFPITSQALLASWLLALGKKIKLSLTLDYFSVEINPNFKKDRIDISNIDFSTFQMRICNYLLEIIHKQGSYTESLHEFLFENFKSREEAKGREVDSDSEDQSSQGSKEDRFFLSSLVDQIMDEVKNEKPKKEKKTPKKPQEIKPKQKKYEEFQHKWSDDFLETFQEDLQKIFKSKLKKGELHKKDTKILFQELFKQINLFVDDIQLTDLQDQAETFLFQGQTSALVTFENFQNLLKNWGKTFNISQKTFKGKLKKTLNKLEDLSIETQDFSNLSKTVLDLKSNLEQLFTKIQKDPQEIPSKTKKNLEEIFHFYAKGQKIQGIEKTFEGLESSNSTWNLGKFFRFFQDFQLFSTRNEKSRLSRGQLSSVFQKHSKNSRIMDFKGFSQSLFTVAERFGSFLLGEDLSSKSLNEKFNLLLNFLSLDEGSSFQSKLKGFNKPHSPESHQRIPKFSSRRLSNDYQLPDSFIKQVEDWKNKKFNQHNMTPTQVKKSEILEKHEKIRRLRKSSLDGYGYSGKNKKKNIRESLSPNLKELKSSEEIEKFFEVREKDLKSLRFVTIEDLNQMKYQDFDDQDFLELINEEKDDFFDSFYKIEPRLQGIFKMHQEKVDKGLRVIEKARPSLSNKKIFK
jgi:hypothetical protein